MIYPWFQPLIDQIELSYQKERLAHALLFQGDLDIGVECFVLDLAKRFTCQTNDALSYCNQCQHCELWLNNDIHPNVFELAKPGESISVEMVRQIKERIYLTGHQFKEDDHCPRIVIINQVERLNESQSNALLKLLEEPPENVYFFMTTQSIDQLLPTIQSRCQKFYCHVDFSLAKSWIVDNLEIDKSALSLDFLWEITNHRPLFIQKLIANKGYFELRSQLLDLIKQRSFSVQHLIKDLKDEQLSWIIFWLYLLIVDIMRCKLNATDSIINSDCLDAIKQAASQYTYHELIKRYQKLTYWADEKLKGHHLNKALWLENWFL
ncbi:hypothetical protein L3V86_04760 [Thiotrichales bacterium 19S11-10]|nr:hypothetical protein [Thiotrichales bacterium 19S11-10]